MAINTAVRYDIHHTVAIHRGGYPAVEHAIDQRNPDRQGSILMFSRTSNSQPLNRPWPHNGPLHFPPLTALFSFLAHRFRHYHGSPQNSSDACKLTLSCVPPETTPQRCLPGVNRTQVLVYKRWGISPLEHLGVPCNDNETPQPWTFFAQ